MFITIPFNGGVCLCSRKQDNVGGLSQKMQPHAEKKLDLVQYFLHCNVTASGKALR